MRKALIQNGKIVKYIDTSIIPKENEVLTENRWAEVIEQDKPEYNSRNQIIKKKIAISDNINITWEKIDLDPIDVELKRVDMIKEHAGSIITSIVSETKQRNIIARMVELNHLEIMTEAQTAEYDSYNLLWDFVKSVRSYSDTMENDLEKPYSNEGNWPKWQS